MSMYRTARVVKRTRVSDRPDAPFGAGILRSAMVFPADHTAADDAWWANYRAMLEAEATAEFPGSEGWMDSAEMEERARQAEWEDKYNALAAAEDRCDLCGLAGFGVGDDGLCSGCRFAGQWEGIAD